MTFRTRTNRMAPRAENVIRHVNDTILYSLKKDFDAAQINLHPIVDLAYMVVNETGTLPYQVFDSDAFVLIRGQ